jgi:hypothetical protein
MTTNSPKHVNPRDVARLLGLSPSQVKARVRESASAQATARTSSRTNILMLNDDILGKVMGKYSELVNRPDITTQEERLRMLEHIVGKLESRLNSKQKFLDDISKDIDAELISTYLKEANDILANVRKSIRIIKAKQKRGTKILGLVKKSEDMDIIEETEKEIEEEVILYINEIGKLLKSVNSLILRIRRRINNEEQRNHQSGCVVS